MIENFIESAIIIDDVKKEVDNLKSHLEEKDIMVKYYHPKELKERKTPLKNKKIIFLDLFISETARKPIEHIAEIRSIFRKVIGKKFGTYGIVVWSAHTDEIDLLKSKIQNDTNEYTLPLFIVSLRKDKYINQNNFNNIFQDLDKELNENIAANFFIQWFTLVNEGRDKAITNIYSLVEDYKKQDNNLQYILFKLALNYTGIPVEKIGNYPLLVDAFKAFNDMLNYEITSNQKIDCKIFNDPLSICYIGKDANYKKRIDKYFLFKETILKPPYKAEHKDKIAELKKEIENILSGINKKLMLDDINGNQEIVLPGNIYEIIDQESIFKTDEQPSNSKPIIIEITPPCDFANKKIKKNRVLGGFISDFTKPIYDNLKGICYYKEISPISINETHLSQMIIFDFRYFGILDETELKNVKKYKLILRAKDKLFADILQKLSSHTARLGLAIIQEND